MLGDEVARSKVWVSHTVQKESLSGILTESETLVCRFSESLTYLKIGTIVIPVSKMAENTK